jgi:hypothetical protein
MTKVLGHTFREMTDYDWQLFAGAEPGTLICTDLEDRVLLWDPARQRTLQEIRYDAAGRSSAWEWECEEINTEPEFGE